MTFKLSYLSTIFALLAFTNVSFGQEANLKKAKAAFESADKELNKVYQKAKAKLGDFDFQQLQFEQRKWLEYREYRSKAAANFDAHAEEGEEKDHFEYWDLAGAITETRTKLIEALIQPEKFQGLEWQGIWEDGRGGHLEIVENDDKTLSFLVHCVRGPTYHTGSLPGKAKVNGSLARFSIQEDGEDNEAWLTFIRDGSRLKLIGVNTMYYHGARAYFDGDYIRTETITSEQLKKNIGDLEI